MTTLRLLQHRAEDGTRSVILAEGDAAHVLTGVASVRELALRAIEEGNSLAATARACGIGDAIDIAAEQAAGRLIAPIDHADEAHVLLTGTGLTHLGSAEGRNKMHQAAASGENVTDSMRMFLEGLEGGKPAEGQEGQQPEWFYKGDGSQLVGPGEALTMPSFAKDGGEEPELAGIYLIYLIVARKVRLSRSDTAKMLRDLPWPWLLGIGIALMAASLIVLSMSSGDDRGGTYVPAHMEDGKVVPAKVE